MQYFDDFVGIIPGAGCESYERAGGYAVVFSAELVGGCVFLVTTEGECFARYLIVERIAHSTGLLQYSVFAAFTG